LATIRVFVRKLFDRFQLQHPRTLDQMAETVYPVVDIDYDLNAITDLARGTPSSFPVEGVTWITGTVFTNGAAEQILTTTDILLPGLYSVIAFPQGRNGTLFWSLRHISSAGEVARVQSTQPQTQGQFPIPRIPFVVLQRGDTIRAVLDIAQGVGVTASVDLVVMRHAIGKTPIG